MKTAYRNSQWISRVRALLKEGFGVEDIAVELVCDVEKVRLEVQILRAEGELDGIYRHD